MELQVRYSTHPEDSKYYDTKALRKSYLQENIFIAGKVMLTYSHNDRIIFGGIMPVGKPLALDAGKELGTAYFFERREAGIINIGGKGSVVLDGKAYTLDKNDGMYVPIGIVNALFDSCDTQNPAKFFINSCPAHKQYDIVNIGLADAKHINLGDAENLNVRTINQYIHPDVCKSCQF